MKHDCCADCDPPVHATETWLRPMAEVAVMGGGDPYAPPVVRAVLGTVFHQHGWRVRGFQLLERDRDPREEHSERWKIWIEPCPDCGPPACPPFTWFGG